MLDTTLVVNAATGGAIRWAVGSRHGPRSGTWRVWNNKKGDLYLAVRSLGGIVKTSFHRDGRCQTGLTQEHSGYSRVSSALQGSRHWDRWELRSGEQTRAMQIAIPASELRTFESEEAGQMVWLPPPPIGHLTTVTLFIAQRQNSRLPWNAPTGPIQPLGLLTAGPRVAWVVHTQHPLTGSAFDMIEEYRGRIVESDFGKNVPKTRGRRAVLWGHQTDGDRFFVELAWDESS